MTAHVRRTVLGRRDAGSPVSIACTCGWQSQPCANGEFANQAWERHAAEQGGADDGDERA